MWRAFGRMPSEFLANKRARPACSLHVDGPIAQLVEQLAFNQWVAGSSPARLKSHIVIAVILVALNNAPKAARRSAKTMKKTLSREKV